ncbi:unnamed protein product [Adineta ricciae]|uniref:G-protein coupled receptors family 1 profile domain-containing protein n=1 Tax=Adineta ricciae TaxID=249248 RepID=A0A813X8N5_ADIRI|nr:unnamed protein product [Adineta ricciae]CAF0964729.1 unnamed protein product [Adineta ricciae]
MASLDNILSSIQKHTLFGLAWIYVVFGVIGCVLHIILLARTRFRKTSCYTYVLGATVGMMFSLFIYSIPIIYRYHKVDSFSYSVYFCKFRVYFDSTTSVAYRLLLSAAFFDLYASSASNVRLRRLANVRFAYRAIPTITVLVLLAHVYLLITTNIKAGACGNTLVGISLTFVNLFTLFNNSFLPTAIMIVCTLLTRKNLTQKRKRRQDLDAQRPSNNRIAQIQLKRDQQVFRLLFNHVVTFFIITFPSVIYSVSNIVSPYIANKSADQITIENFLRAMAEGLSYLFPAFTFYINTLTSSMFRKELWTILRGWFSCGGAITNKRVGPEPVQQTVSVNP